MATREAAGSASSRLKQFAAFVHEVHKMMSWDEDGCPLPATLIDRHLEWAMDGAAAAAKFKWSWTSDAIAGDIESPLA